MESIALQCVKVLPLGDNSRADREENPFVIRSPAESNGRRKVHARETDTRTQKIMAFGRGEQKPCDYGVRWGGVCVCVGWGLLH